MITQKNIQQATQTILTTLEEQNFSLRTISGYRSVYQKLNLFIQEEDFDEVNETVLLHFLEKEFKVCVQSVYTKGHSRAVGARIKPITILSYYLLTGVIDHRARMRTPPFECPEGYYQAYADFNEFLISKGLSSSSIRNNIVIVQQLICLLEEEGITSIDGLSPSDILSVLPKFQNSYKNSFEFALYPIRNFLMFLYNNGFLEEEISSILPRIRVSKNIGIPHSWSKDEIKSILNSIDRANPVGKRDYAILLLITQTGLRVADIRKLSLSDVDWQNHKIRIVMSKNSNLIELPLLENTGWAIIDYLQNGRPKTSSKNIFIRHIPPFDTIGSASGLNAAFYRYLLKSGVQIKSGERHGIHTLRNSLAKNMLEAGIPLTTISQTLGHKNSNTTAIYLKIDIDSLRKCALSYDESEDVLC